MNIKLVAGFVVIVLLMGMSSFIFGHTADAQKSDSEKKPITKVEKQKENRQKTMEDRHIKSIKKWNISKIYMTS